MFPFSELKDIFIMICSNKFISFCSVFIVIMVFNGYLYSAMFGTDELAENTKFQESSNHLVHLDQMNFQNLPLNDSSYKLNRELSSLNNNGTYEINKTSKHGEISNTEAINGIVDKFDFEVEKTELDDLSVPNIFDFLPDITYDLKSLRPVMKISMGKCNVSMIIGIPTVKRHGESYLITTLHSIFENISKNNTVTENILIVVMISEFIDLDFVISTVEKLQSEFGNHIDRGFLDIIVPSPKFYPNFSNIDLSFGDSVEQVKWRSKQNLDYAYLMMYARNRGINYYLQLEDDVMVAFKY